MSAIGIHLLVDMYGVPAEALRDCALLEQALMTAVKRGGLRAVSAPIVRKVDEEDGGVTGVVLLSESHIAFHTYPEMEYVALDAFTCGRFGPERAVETFAAAVGAERVETRRTSRGQGLRTGEESQVLSARPGTWD